MDDYRKCFWSLVAIIVIACIILAEAVCRLIY